MRILVTEDDEAKMAAIVKVVADTLPAAELATATSLTSAIREMTVGIPEIAVLDMTIPSFDIDLNAEEDGGLSQSLGGQELLRELEFREANCKAIVVTQFEQFGKGREALSRQQLAEELREEFGERYLGMVYYRANEESWKVALASLLRTAAMEGK